MKWKKIGQIFNPQIWNDGIKREWMYSHSQCTSALVFDNFVRVYFSCRPPKDNDGQATSHTTFLDLDRGDLTKIIRVSEKPILPLGGAGSFDENAVYPTSVIRDGDSIRLYYAGWSRCKSVPFNTSIGLAISQDGGETFNRVGTGPILSADINEPYVISGPKVRIFDGKWYLYYLAGTEWVNNDGKMEIIYKNKMATSTDGIKWDREDRNIIEDRLGKYECQAGPDVFYYGGKYHMYFVYREGLEFREIKGRGYKIGYATSVDKYNWRREDDVGGIGYSETGWDSQMQHYPHVFEVENNHYMLYNGNDFGRFGFGLAILEK